MKTNSDPKRHDGSAGVMARRHKLDYKLLRFEQERFNARYAPNLSIFVDHQLPCSRFARHALLQLFQPVEDDVDLWTISLKRDLSRRTQSDDLVIAHDVICSCAPGSGVD